jgi:hypothetical protein
MPGPKMIAIVTALLMISGVARGQSGYSLADLEEIDRLISGKDCTSLWSYVRARPELMAGNDALARELRVFVQSTERGMLDCFAARAPAPAPVDVSSGPVPTPAAIY